MITNNQLFLESVVHGEHRVYGHKLKPLSLFHLSMLENFKSPLVYGGTLTPESIATAAIICSSKNSQDFNRKFRKLSNHLKFFWYNPQKELIRWESYWTDYFSIPETFDKEQKASNPLPLVASCTAAVIKSTGWSFDYVFYDLPVGLLIWLTTSFSYLENGETAVISDKERETMERVRALTGG